MVSVGTNVIIFGNRPFRNLAKGTGDSVVHSDSFANNENRGIPSASVINVWLASQSHLPANSSYFRVICTFQELHDTCLLW